MKLFGHSSEASQGKLEAERRQELVTQGKELKGKLAELEVEVDRLEILLQIEGQKLPNFAHPDVSMGRAVWQKW